MTTSNLGSCFDAFLHAGVHPSAFGFIQIGLSIFCMCSTSRSDSDWWFPSECGFELVLAAYLIHCIVASPSSWFTSVNAYFISISLLVSNDIEDSLHRSLVSLLTLYDLVSPTLTTTETACSKHSLKKKYIIQSAQWITMSFKVCIAFYQSTRSNTFPQLMK